MEVVAADNVQRQAEDAALLQPSALAVVMAPLVGLALLAPCVALERWSNDSTRTEELAPVTVTVHYCPHDDRSV